MNEPIYSPASGMPPPPDVGGKARGLVAVAEAGQRTAPWFAIRAGAIPAGQPIDEHLRSSIEDACRRIAPAGSERFAVRSSAPAEDGARQSYAGQYRTFLNVGRGDELLEAIAGCAHFNGHDALAAYRGGSGPIDEPIAVIVQCQVDAECAGVALSCDPLTGAPEVVIAAVRGLAEPLVRGTLDGVEYRVSSEDAVRVMRTPEQAWRAIPGPDGGVVRADLAAPVGHVLDDSQVRMVATATRALERAAGAPQDVEWVFAASGELYVLQVRPITALPNDDPRRGETRVWDNANIIESFPDLTLPLTFSVATELYADVYRQACRAMGVSPHRVDRESEVFEQMLGLIEGRVYYNLRSWHRVVSFLPGVRHNQRSLEAMMGAAGPSTAVPGGGAASSPSLTRWLEHATIGARLLVRWARFDADAGRFRSAIDELLEDHGAVPAGLDSPEELLAAFGGLRARALHDWRPPILNDLFLMVFHGALRRAAGRWCGEGADALVNALIGQAGAVSAAPATDLLSLAAAIERRSDWRETVASESADALHARLRDDPELAELARLVTGYVARWGDRAPRELQLDRPTYREDPTPLLEALRSIVGQRRRGGERRADERRRATREAASRMLTHPLGPLRLMLFFGLVAATRRHLRWREEMRLARGQVFGVGRRIFARLGTVLVERDVLDRPEDVHYLSIRELRALCWGTAVTTDARALVSLRRTHYEAWAAAPPPPSRFETVGLPGAVGSRRHTDAGARAPDPVGATSLRGTGAAAGRARGACVVIADAHDAPAVDGRIVVARSTDPGWVPLLLGAAGLLVEHGSLLSHSAIIARELGIPTVVGLPGLLDRVRTGQTVALDGATGDVWLEAPPGDAR